MFDMERCDAPDRTIRTILAVARRDEPRRGEAVIQEPWCTCATGTYRARMPRRTAAERRAQSPSKPWPPRTEPELIDAIVAINHPLRRALYEALDGGAADVGTLADRIGVAPGSASHHLGVLASAGWIEQAPDLAPDTRHTVWRSLGRLLSWSSDDLTPGSHGRRIADSLVAANVTANHDVLMQALSDPASRFGVTLSDWHARASDAQCADLDARIRGVVAAWREEVDATPDEGRTPRRIVMWQAPQQVRS